nr:DUF448 domain-containing protein [uncultured Leptotrichia sp.]
MDTLNRNVKENKPERMCICCRRKDEKDRFFRLSEQDGKYIFDKEMKVQARGFYVCKTNECIERLSKHKKYNIEIEQLVKMLEQLKNEKKSIIDILRPMKNSAYFVFGIDEVFDGIKRDKIKLVIIPLDIKAKYIEEFEKMKKNFNFEIIFIEKKKELIRLFSRDVNVIGIFNKKVIKGILSKVEVMNG